MITNLIKPFLYPFIINGIAKAPLMVFTPAKKQKTNNQIKNTSTRTVMYCEVDESWWNK